MYRYIIILIFAVVLNKDNAVNGQNADCNSRPPRVDLDACCDIPQLVPDTVFDKCIADNFNKGSPPNGRPKRGPHHHGRMHCKMSECILNELKLLQNNELDTAAVKNYIDTFDAEWRPILTTAIDNCTAEAKTTTTNISNNNDMPENFDCKPTFMHFIPCVHRLSYVNCPANKYTDNAECNGAKEFMEKCPPPPHMRRGPPPY